VEARQLLSRRPSRCGGASAAALTRVARPKQGKPDHLRGPALTLPVRAHRYGGDFGPVGTPSDGIFCANGLLLPDGSLNPHAHEVRHVYAALRIEARALNSTGATLSLSSELRFRTEEVLLRWELLRQGVPLCSAEAGRLAVPPGGAMQTHLSLLGRGGACRPPPREHGDIGDVPGIEHHLNVELLLVRPPRPLPPRHRAAAAQFIFEPAIAVARGAPLPPVAVATGPSVGRASWGESESVGASPRLVVLETDAAIEVRAGRLVLSFGRCPSLNLP